MKVAAGIIAALMVSAPVAAQPVVVFGPADMPSCGAWTDARAKQRAEANAYQMWALGFLSGLNWARSPTRGDVGRSTDAQGVLAWIDKYCLGAPLDSLLVAVITLDNELATRARR